MEVFQVKVTDVRPASCAGVEDVKTSQKDVMLKHLRLEGKTSKSTGYCLKGLFSGSRLKLDS